MFVFGHKHSGAGRPTHFARQVAMASKSSFRPLVRYGRRSKRDPLLGFRLPIPQTSANFLGLVIFFRFHCCFFSILKFYILPASATLCIHIHASLSSSHLSSIDLGARSASGRSNSCTRGSQKYGRAKSVYICGYNAKECSFPSR